MELVGKLVKLRAKTREDLALYVRWLNDPTLAPLLRGGMLQPISLEKLTARFEQQLRADCPDVPSELGYVIADLRDNRGVGCIGLQHIDWKNRCGSQLFMLVDPMTGLNRGLASSFYAAEALVLFLQHLFSNLGLHRIEAETLAFNCKVLRGIEKAGFKREGVRRECVYIAGRYADLFCYGLLRSDFYNSHHVRWILERLEIDSTYLQEAELEQDKAKSRKEDNLCISGTG